MEIVAVDGGGGGQRFKGLRSDGAVVEREYGSFTLGEGSLTENYLSRFAKFVSEGFTSIDRIVMAVAALPGSESERKNLTRAILDQTGARELWLTSDITAAHFACVTGDGVVTTVGTGIGAIAVGKGRTQLHELSGDGYLIGDEGSAFWIGKMGLNRALRAKDGRGGSNLLLDAALNFFDTDAASLADLVTALERPVHRIAQFAPTVTSLAEGGDASALEIVEEAVDEYAHIALTARRVLQAEEDFQIVFSGGAIPKSGITYRTLARRLSSLGLICEHSEARNIDGAFELAQQSNPGVYAAITDIVHA